MAVLSLRLETFSSVEGLLLPSSLISVVFILFPVLFIELFLAFFFGLPVPVVMLRLVTLFLLLGRERSVFGVRSFSDGLVFELTGRMFAWGRSGISEGVLVGFGLSGSVMRPVIALLGFWTSVDPLR